MKLIVGLGNPGLRFKYTRHNIGLRVIDALAKEKRIKFKTSFKIKARVAKGKIYGEDINLFKSLRFMNICGSSLAPFMLERNIDVTKLLVVSDCLDLAFGRMRFRDRGSDAGHRGMRSLMTSLGSSDFSRLKIGIGRPEDPDIDVSEFVLARFSQGEEKQILDIIEEAKLKIYDWIKPKGDGKDL